jgi:hypothetical protein
MPAQEADEPEHLRVHRRSRRGPARSIWLTAAGRDLVEGRPMTTSPLTRAGLTGALAVTCVGLAGLALAGPASAATPDSGTAGHFLAGQLQTGGDHFTVTGYADYGATIDAVLALDAAKTGQGEAGRATSYVVKNAAAYNSYGTALYAGATAKLLVFAQAQGLPTARYLTQLKSLEQPTGQFQDRPATQDYSNTIGQSLAIVGLTRAGQSDASAVSFLAKQQCADGGFRMSFTGSACTGDTDATSLAVQALSAAGGHQAEIAKAASFIASKQQANGGVVEPASQASANANSSGLAAVAFTLAGRTAEATKAKNFVSSLQLGCSAPSALRGAIAFDQKGFQALKAKGAKAAPSDQERRASSQALLALDPQPYLTLRAGGATVAPALTCAAPAKTSVSATPSATADPDSGAASTTTGPVVVTDGNRSNGGNGHVLLAGAAVLGGAVLVGGGVRRRMSSHD